MHFSDAERQMAQVCYNAVENTHHIHKRPVVTSYVNLQKRLDKMCPGSLHTVSLTRQQCFDIGTVCAALLREIRRNRFWMLPSGTEKIHRVRVVQQVMVGQEDAFRMEEKRLSREHSRPMTLGMKCTRTLRLSDDDIDCLFPVLEAVCSAGLRDSRQGDAPAPTHGNPPYAADSTMAGPSEEASHTRPQRSTVYRTGRDTSGRPRPSTEGPADRLRPSTQDTDDGPRPTAVPQQVHFAVPVKTVHQARSITEETYRRTDARARDPSRKPPYVVERLKGVREVRGDRTPDPAPRPAPPRTQE